MGVIDSKGETVNVPIFRPLHGLMAGSWVHTIELIGIRIFLAANDKPPRPPITILSWSVLDALLIGGSIVAVVLLLCDCADLGTKPKKTY